jgi:NAD(P)-dependent dehydrogenase (short-subunit alcohol dehydrogenase family)
MKMKSLDGKKVVITGAASGLGRSLALALARKGCRIGVADVNTEGAAETLEMVKAAGGDGETFKLDVSQPEEVEAMAAHFFEKWGGVDLLVNNAGVVVAGTVGDIPLENWKWIFDVNFWGMLYGCHYFIPRMKAQGKGYILNVASAAGLISLMHMAPYNTTKAAVISLTETLKMELAAERNIGFTVLCPMFFNTHLLDNMKFTNEFEPEFAHATFDYARMTSDEVAEVALKAVEKGRIYCVPQFNGRYYWALKRLNPFFFTNMMAFMNRYSWGKQFFMWMARKGMVQ